jgi:magnesium chelatase subunit D
MSAPIEAATPWRRASLAAALFAIDPVGNGVIVRAGPGPVRDAWLGLLVEALPAGAPLRRAPANIADDRLLGGLDITATLRAGRPVAEPGIIAQADGGVLVLAMAERSTQGTAARISSALDRGVVTLARDGFAMEMPARLGVVALDEGQGDDERPPEALVDRMGYWVDLTSIGWREIEGAAYSADELVAARAKLGGVEAEPSVVEALVVVAARLGVASLRAPLFALRAARALAALRGGVRIEDDDVALAASLVLAPRATRMPAEEDNEPEPEPESEPPPPPDDAQEPSDPSEPQDDTMPDLDDLVLAAAQAAIPPDLLARIEAGASRRRKSSSDGKSGAFSISKLRGRPTEARAGTLKEGRLSLVATLRAAAPWQRVRGGESPAVGGNRLQIKPDDFRIVRYRQRRGATTVFILDASGSSAMQRLAEVKGAIELLLADCYIRRDSVALVAFRGRGAEIVLPPTRSTARARRALAGLPAGGGTPIANGLDVALALADQIQHKGQTPLLVLMTDGRANIARDGTPGRPQALQDAIDAGRRIRASGVSALAIDTSPPTSRPDAPSFLIAEAMQAIYVKLPYANATMVNEAVRAAVGS